MTEEMRKVCITALQTYGKPSQTVVLCEECAELIQASSKLLRNGEHPELVMNMTEEIADVLIMIEQMKISYSISDFDINVFIDQKINRLRERLDKGRKS